MMSESDARERHLGWILAAVTGLHIILLRPQPAVALAAFAVLLTGAMLRSRQVFAPGWLAWSSLVIGIVAVILAPGRIWLASMLGDMAAMAAVLFLLRPLTPARGQRVLFCLLVMVASAIMKNFPLVGRTFLVIDVAILLILAEQIHRPPEARVNFWVAVARSLRVVVPVGLVVTAVFWFFPNLSVYTPPVVGFSGSESLRAGNIAELAQSRRTAFTATFGEDQPIPFGDTLYWRGRVLELNNGLNWSMGQRNTEQPRILQDEPPEPSTRNVRYSQEIPALNRFGIVPVLDHATYIEATRDGETVAVLELGAGVLSSVGLGALKLDVASSLDMLVDEPDLDGASLSTAVPKEIRSSAAIQAITAKIFTPGQDLQGKLRAIGQYFRSSGFSYSMRPGQIEDMEDFLLRKKKGFCEHFATTAANLLRLSGTPTRVVTGYRGGQWNPWLRSLIVRNSDAHAWIEAWDAPAGRWVRYDPTNYVAPHLRERIQQELDSTEWPWYRRAWSYGQALSQQGSARLQDWWNQVSSSELWEYTPTALFMALVAVALFWLVRNLRARQAEGAYETAARLLTSLEQNALRYHRERKPGETPLAWLIRLERATLDSGEKHALQNLASAWESHVYKAPNSTEDSAAALRSSARMVKKTWKASGSVDAQSTRSGQSPGDTKLTKLREDAPRPAA